MEVGGFLERLSRVIQESITGRGKATGRPLPHSLTRLKDKHEDKEPSDLHMWKFRCWFH